MPLVTHVGAGTNAHYSGLEGVALLQIESGGFTSRRAIWWLIFAGVFERHPGLKLVITETPGSWFPTTAAELDAVWSFYDAKRDEPLNQALLDQVPRSTERVHGRQRVLRRQLRLTLRGRAGRRCTASTPSCCGARTTPTSKAPSSTPTASDMPSVTRLSLRNTFCNVPPAETRCAWSDENAIDVYGLDGDALQASPPRSARPTLEELATPIDAVPDGASVTAFRSGAGGWS